MSRLAYVNGRYVPHRSATVHVEDRGLQFSDGVYEVIAIVDGRPVDLTGHMVRLDRSLRELRIAPPMPARALRLVLREVVRRNAVADGIVYIQINRGVFKRDHPFPPSWVAPSLVVTARTGLGPPAHVVEQGVRVITVPDRRWTRRDIKSVSLLPNVLARQAAREAGAFEAWQVDVDGLVTEGSATNAWIVTPEGRLVTRPLGDDILAGITRQVVRTLAAESGLTVEERPFPVAEAQAAREAFLTSTTSLALPVVCIDDTPVGDGAPGPVTRRLRTLYAAHMTGAGGESWVDA